MDLWLSAGVYAVMIDDDVVFLDVATNAYFCLPAVGSVLALEGRSLRVAARELAEDLIQAGLASAAAAIEPPPSTPAPVRTARAVLEALPARERPRPRLAHWRQAIMAGLASRAAERRPFAQRLPPPSTGVSPPASEGLLADLDAFRRLQPWLPFDGACLFRSQMLRDYLLALGHRVDWIFGVRTWPFGAHCWLQAGDLVLDDEAERLIAYHPIMVR
ncbi:lasso peptide biosynthesis B2 protein [Caulobacter segnis]|uniref:Microcin J25-processing protein McjB C-terminal domain-containing protein n=2 Tax=Caulobacter segnis TaxID=88688 RepID=D5VKJ6_CAUST|nr:lasso peptide biosynthesis B2 protein [Caulobacter segnis]ADG11019.1 conserved hypothetical protein [Caulobacter segnis ATCC 21756]AVQ02709.1 lasso peptide biosynthesis B2 protein [Caulobacter segnis]